MTKMTVVKNVSRWPIAFLIGLVTVSLSIGSVKAQSANANPTETLTSWRDGEVRQAIERFVERVTTRGSADYVTAGDRIAVFDNDGTLWSEKPWVEGEFKKYQIEQAVARDPSRRDTQPFKAAFEKDYEYFKTGGWPVFVVAARAVTAELSRDEYNAEVKKFFETGRHPSLNVPYQQTVYQPALDLIEYLNANGFSTYICSGDGVDFMRMVSRQLYGVEPDRVIGSSLKKELRRVKGRWELVAINKVNVFNDKEQKAISIDLHIGQRPLLVMGNVGGGGDIGMLEYSQGREGLSLQLLVNHDDGVREFAYAEKNNVSLNTAKANGWLVVSMKDDWSLIYPPAGK